MNKNDKSATIGNAERGGLTDLGKILREHDGRLNELDPVAFQANLGNSATGTEIATAVNGLRSALVSLKLMLPS